MIEKWYAFTDDDIEIYEKNGWVCELWPEVTGWKFARSFPGSGGKVLVKRIFWK